ncbi:hypothetical protein [Qipengyuania sp. MTN3-11]|uniref:hypothetical protein n=1 Tax=Qipengyuania sp. MTN3-11 TaxID=3056557 RepID=UPI0036F27D18
MLTTILAAILAQAAPAQFSPARTLPPPDENDLVDLPIEQQTALRCAVAIALAAERQRQGQAEGQDWPDLLAQQRGREFFVRTFARLIDDTGLTREDLALRGRREAEDLTADESRLDAVMPACTLLFEASGL